MVKHEMEQDDPANQLTATAPSGAKVVAVLEVSSCRPMLTSLYAQKGPGGRITVDYVIGDESGCVYGQVVDIDGQRVYADADGVLWPASAVTFHSADGSVLIKGDSSTLPLADVDIAAAAEVNLKAQLLVREGGGGRGQADWDRVVAQQGWNSESELSKLRSLVDAMGLWPVATAYGKLCARNENTADA